MSKIIFLGDAAATVKYSVLEAVEIKAGETKTIDGREFTGPMKIVTKWKIIPPPPAFGQVASSPPCWHDVKDSACEVNEYGYYGDCYKCGETQYWMDGSDVNDCNTSDILHQHAERLLRLAMEAARFLDAFTGDDSEMLRFQFGQAIRDCDPHEYYANGKTPPPYAKEG